MRYLIGKIGQKVIFNRNSQECDRSNTNGNVGVYTFFNLLIEMNPNDEFIFVGESDLENSQYLKMHRNLSLTKSFDNAIGIFMLGINRDSKIEKIIQTGIEYVLVNDDERCLDSFEKIFRESKLTNLPRALFGQSSKEYTFNEVKYFLRYLPVEKTILYKSRFIFQKEKKNDLIVIANTSGEKYDRLSIVKELVGTQYPVYGRLDKRQYPENFKGEVKYTEVEQLLKTSLTTLLVPVRKDCMTSKWVEAIMKGCYPIFYKDYPAQFTDISEIFIVSSKEDLLKLLDYILSDKNKILEDIQRMQTKMKKYTDGTLLNNQIMNAIKGELS